MANQLPRQSGSDDEKKLNALRAELRDRLLPHNVPTAWVTREIERFFMLWRDERKPSISRLIAKQLARHLVSKWPFASTTSVESAIETEIHRFLAQASITPAVAKTIGERLMTKWCFASTDAIDRVIQNRPELLEQAVTASTLDEIERTVQSLPDLPPPKQRRKKPSSDEERAQQITRSKKRYDRHRPYRSTCVGLIEREFGERRFLLTDPFSTEPPSGSCLDSLLRGGEVTMRKELYCMEALFGFDRHKFPKRIIFTRRDRSVFYNLHSVMQCMVFFLNEERSGKRWLPEPVRRQLVITGVIKRADDVGTKEVAAFVKQTLQPFLK